jgi:AcrR family transcriptional regulator
MTTGPNPGSANLLAAPSCAPVARRRQADRSALSDRRLTEAAIELLVRLGIEGTTLQAVGEQAGYSRALATHRFGSKAGLFGQVLKVANTEWLERLQKAVGTKVGVKSLCAVTNATEKFIRERPNVVRVMYMLWFQSIDPAAAFHPNIAAVHRAQRRDVENWVRAGQKAGEIDPAVNSRRVAEQYCATMVGIAYQWLANADMPLAAMYRELKENLPLLLPAPRARAAGRRKAT